MVFFTISKKQELIEQNDGHFWIKRPQITLKKFLYTLQQTDIFFVGQYYLYVFKFLSTFLLRRS